MQRRFVSLSASITRVALLAATGFLGTSLGGCGQTVMGPDLGTCEGSLCGLGCNSDTDCNVHPGRPKCEPASKTCVPCLDDNNCALGQLCQASTHTCADACTRQRGCGDAGVCETDA